MAPRPSSPFSRSVTKLTAFSIARCRRFAGKNGSIFRTNPSRSVKARDTSEEVDGPLTLQVYPGVDRRFLLYEDDGESFGYRSGDWMGLDLSWNDAGKRLSIQLAEGSRMRPPLERTLELRMMPDGAARSAVFTGQKLEVSW